MRSLKLLLLICVVLVLFTRSSTANEDQCRELNQVNCYMGKNEGYVCSKENHSKPAQTRWYYDKGVCRKFDYKGCWGNRNRFCTKEACEQRCKS